MLKKCLVKVRDQLDKLCVPEQDEIVLRLVLNTSSLELAKHEVVELAPLKGLCGPFRLSGNALPVFEYLMFEKSIMEFVQVRVEVARPDIIRYITTIYAKPESSTAPERHGEVIETTDRYKKPFQQLALHLYRYFGHYVTPEKRNGR